MNDIKLTKIISEKNVFDETKICPNCNQELKITIQKCPNCNKFLGISGIVQDNNALTTKFSWIYYRYAITAFF